MFSSAFVHYQLTKTSNRMKEGAGGIILNREGKLLMVEQHGNSWSFPKGGVEKGESLLEAARREIAEETGITDLHYLGELGSYERYSIGKEGVGENRDWPLRKRTLFLFRTDTAIGTPNDPDGEITDVRWATVEEALQLLTHPKDSEFLESMRERLAHWHSRN